MSIVIGMMLQLCVPGVDPTVCRQSADRYARLMHSLTAIALTCLSLAAAAATLVVCASTASAQTSPSAKAEYFPSELNLHKFKSSWYSSQLTGFQEKPLSLLTNRDRCIRFLWLRSFHYPVCIRVEFPPDAQSCGRVTAKERTGSQTIGARFGPVTQTTSSLTPAQLSQVSRIIAKEDFWKPDADTMGCDGSQWIVESWDQGTYRMTDRWSPDYGSVRELGIELLKMGNLYEKNTKELY